MIDLLLLNTILQILWYISFSIFVIYKYTGLFLQIRGFLRFTWGLIKSFGWLCTKTYYYLTGNTPTSPETEPLLPKYNQPPSKFKRLWLKTKGFFGFREKNTIPQRGIILENISNSHLLHKTPDQSEYYGQEYQINHNYIQQLSQSHTQDQIINYDSKGYPIPNDSNMFLENNFIHNHFEQYNHSPPHSITLEVDPEPQVYTPFHEPPPFARNSDSEHSMYHSIG